MQRLTGKEQISHRSWSLQSANALSRFASDRYLDMNAQPRIRIFCCDCAVVHLDRAFRDRQAKPGTSSKSVTCRLHAEEWIKDSGQCILGNSGTVVSDRNVQSVRVLCRKYINTRPLWRITNSISNDIFDGPSQQFSIAHQFSRRPIIRCDVAIASLSLQAAVANDFAEHFAITNCCRPLSICLAFDDYRLNQIGYQASDAIDIRGDSIQGNFRVCRSSCKSYREFESRQRRSQFVRYVSQQPSLAHNLALKAFRHFVERSSQLPDFIRSVAPHSNREISTSEVGHGGGYSANGRDDSDRSQPT